jgi:hypothetical protein
LLANESVAEVFPTLFGVNDTFNCTVWPAPIVTGKVAPGRENCALLLAAEETVTLAPVALRVAACVPVSSMSTLPKFSVLGEMVNCPIFETVPVPVNGMFSAGPEIKTLPPLTAAACGVNETLSLTLWPALRVKGKLGPLTEKPVPPTWKAFSV